MNRRTVFGVGTVIAVLSVALADEHMPTPCLDENGNPNCYDIPPEGLFELKDEPSAGYCYKCVTSVMRAIPGSTYANYTTALQSRTVSCRKGTNAGTGGVFECAPIPGERYKDVEVNDHLGGAACNTANCWNWD